MKKNSALVVNEVLVLTGYRCGYAPGHEFRVAGPKEDRKFHKVPLMVPELHVGEKFEKDEDGNLILPVDLKIPSDFLKRK